MSRRALGVWAALFYVLLWASAYVPAKVGVLASSPLWFLVFRFLLAGVLALAIARAAGEPFPRGRAEWAAIVALGVLANAIYLGCTFVALRHLASGVGAIVASMNPLVLALVAPVLLAEPLTRGKLAGTLLGFAGVVAIVLARGGTGTAEPRDVALAFAGVLAGVGGTIVFKKWCAPLRLRTMTALQLLAAGFALLPPAIVLEGAPRATWSWQLIAAFAYSALVMSVGASLLWFWLLARGEASRVSAYYFLTPVFGLALAALLLHEPVGPRDAGGLAAIALGIALVQRS